MTTLRARLTDPAQRHPQRHPLRDRRRTALRPAVRGLAAALVVGLVLVSAPALADVPSGWEESEPVPLLRALLVYVFAPLGLFLLVALLTVTPSLVRGERPGVGMPDDQWFGGPRGGTRELEPSEGGTSTGGASGGW